MLLECEKDKGKNEGYVFHRVNQHTITKYFKNYAQKANLPDYICLHSLRHTFASHLIMQGEHLLTVSKLLGHSDIDVTLKYSHLAPEHERKAVGKLPY